MRRLFRRDLLVAIILVLAVLVTLAAVREVDPTGEILQTATRFQQAGLHGDAAFLNQVFDDNVTHFHPGEPYRFTGRERLVREFVAAAARSENPSFEMVEPKVQFATPDVAVLTYYISEHWTEKGSSKSVNEKATEVYVRRNNRWSMIHSHYSLTP